MSKNNMICDLETGVCGVIDEEEMQVLDLNQPQNKVELYYVTDPICSHCWTHEPVLRRFVEQYGHLINFHSVMGGLLEKWDGFGDSANGISKPSDVAGHWREVGELSRMPIDGTLWYDNPIQSSFPPSRVYKVIQKLNEGLAIEFLRRVREAVFAFNQNVGENAILVEIVNSIGLNGEEVVRESEQSIGKQLLKEDFALAANLGVRGFPTIIMVNTENKGVKVVGARSLETYIDGLKQVLNIDDIQPKPQPTLLNLLQKEKLLFSKEIEVMYDVEKTKVHAFVEKELSADRYQVREILGEAYFITASNKKGE